MNDKVLKRMELAKTGTFGPDGAEITLKDLQDIKETFDGKCPVSLGHYMTKQDWWPSWGNVETIDLVIDENGVDAVLFGDVSLTKVLADAIDSGFYTGWSVSMPARASDNKRYLHHLAMLGSVPPKIRDLKVLATAAVKPENAIDVTGEGMDFADQAFYSFADFAVEEGATVETPATDPPAEPAEAKPTATDPPADPGATEFSDKLQAREMRARTIYSTGIRDKVLGKIGPRWPAGKQDDLANFADKLVEAHDWEFADSQEEGAMSLVDLFISLVDSMASQPAPKPGKLDFSDPGTVPGKDVDRAAMAAKF